MCTGLADGLAHGLALVRAEIVEDDHVAFSECGDQSLLDIGEEPLAIGRPVEQAGASMRSWRNAARKVVVFHLPCGTLAIKRTAPAA